MFGQDIGSSGIDDMPPWFKIPIKDVAYSELFQSMTTEEEIQNGPSSETEVDWKWDEQDWAMFAVCQSLTNETLAEEAGIPVEDGQECASSCRKHDSKIFVPEVNGIMISLWLMVIKQLAKNKKVSADCLTRVHQLCKQQQQDVGRDTEDDCDVFWAMG